MGREGLRTQHFAYENAVVLGGGGEGGEEELRGAVGAGKPTLRAIKIVSGLESWVGWEAGPDHTDSGGRAAKPRLLILREETASLGTV